MGQKGLCHLTHVVLINFGKSRFISETGHQDYIGMQGHKKYP